LGGRHQQLLAAVCDEHEVQKRKDKTMMRRIFKTSIFSLLFLLAVSSAARAQGRLPGSAEVAGQVGFSSLTGVDNKKHAPFGFSGTYNASDKLAIVGEYSYQSTGSLTSSGVTATEHIQLFGAASRIYLVDSRRVTPYVLFAGGLARLSASASGISISQNGAYYGAGGGASIYVGSNWGVRPEFRWVRQDYVATTIAGIPLRGGGLNDAQGSVAVFFQFGGRHAPKK
jgi:hypothetical protein